MINPSAPLPSSFEPGLHTAPDTKLHVGLTEGELPQRDEVRVNDARIRLRHAIHLHAIVGGWPSTGFWVVAALARGSSHAGRRMCTGPTRSGSVVHPGCARAIHKLKQSRASVACKWMWFMSCLMRRLTSDNGSWSLETRNGARRGQRIILVSAFDGILRRMMAAVL